MKANLHPNLNQRSHAIQSPPLPTFDEIEDQPEPERTVLTHSQPPSHCSTYRDHTTPPTLHEAALHGVAGRVLRTLAPQTEAHPAALLLQLLAAFSNLIGPGPHCQVEDTRHALNLYVILVGDSSKARKGTSWNHIANLFANVDPAWLATRVNTARLTAHGVIKAMRTQQSPADHRLLALSEEFAAVLHTLKRGNAHLSPLLRSAWDSGHLNLLEFHEQYQNTEPIAQSHISLIAHITQHELAHSFPRQQAHNGFANRCLWTWVERSNCLPTGGHQDPQGRLVLAAAANTIRDAANWATARPEILFTFDREADELWARCYADLSQHHPGLRGAATSRAEAQVLRLSAIYAALDQSDLIRLPHLRAAYAVWDYCAASATRLFGTSTGDTIADRIREAVEKSPDGLSKTQIRRLFSGHVDCDRIDAALQKLTSLGALLNHTEPSRGRYATRWSATEEE